MTITLKTEARSARGKQLAALRKEGVLPAVVYGAKHEAVALSLSLSEFERAYREAGESTVLVLSGAAEDAEVLIHEVSHDPVSSVPLHVDFYAIEKGKKVNVNVSIEFTGEAPALKLGAVLTKVLHELEVEAMPKDLPHELAVDVSGLAAIDDQITVADIAAPAGVTILNDPEEVIVVASAVEEESEESTEAVDMSAVEVEAKGKKEEEEPAA